MYSLDHNVHSEPVVLFQETGQGAIVIGSLREPHATLFVDGMNGELGKDSISVHKSIIVELFRSIEYSLRTGDPTMRLKDAKRVLHSLAPEECDMVSWSRKE